LQDGQKLEISEIHKLIAFLRGECLKVGSSLMFNLQLNFFANYSAVVQAMVSRIDAIVMRIEKLMAKGEGSSEKVEVK
jgi:hypothetical protein